MEAKGHRKSPTKVAAQPEGVIPVECGAIRKDLNRFSGSRRTHSKPKIVTFRCKHALINKLNEGATRYEKDRLRTRSISKELITAQKRYSKDGKMLKKKLENFVSSGSEEEISDEEEIPVELLEKQDHLDQLDFACKMLDEIPLVGTPQELNKLRLLYLRSIRIQGLFEEDFDLSRLTNDDFPKCCNNIDVFIREDYEEMNHLDYGVARSMSEEQLDIYSALEGKIDFNCSACTQEHSRVFNYCSDVFKSLETDMLNSTSCVNQLVIEENGDKHMLYAVIKDVTEKLKNNPNVTKQSLKCKRNMTTRCLRKVQGFFHIDYIPRVSDLTTSMSAMSYEDMKKQLYEKGKDIAVYFNIYFPKDIKGKHGTVVGDNIYVIKIKLIESMYKESMMDISMIIKPCGISEYFDVSEINYDIDSLVPNVYVDSETFGTMVDTDPVGLNPSEVIDHKMCFFSPEDGAHLPSNMIQVGKMTPERSNNGIFMVKFMAKSPVNCHGGLILNSGFSYVRKFSSDVS